MLPSGSNFLPIVGWRPAQVWAILDPPLVNLIQNSKLSLGKSQRHVGGGYLAFYWPWLLNLAGWDHLPGLGTGTPQSLQGTHGRLLRVRGRNVKAPTEETWGDAKQVHRLRALSGGEGHYGTGKSRDYIFLGSLQPDSCHTSLTTLLSSCGRCRFSQQVEPLCPVTVWFVLLPVEPLCPICTVTRWTLMLCIVDNAGVILHCLGVVLWSLPFVLEAGTESHRQEILREGPATQKGTNTQRDKGLKQANSKRQPSRMGYPGPDLGRGTPCLDLGRSTPPSRPGKGGMPPPIGKDGDTSCQPDGGTAPPRNVNRQTPVKTVPSLILGMWAVITHVKGELGMYEISIRAYPSHTS